MTDDLSTPEEAYRDLLDEFGADSLDEVDAAIEMLEAAGKNPRDRKTAWDSAVEFYLHPLDPDNLAFALVEYVDDRADTYREIAVLREAGSLRNTDTPPEARDEAMANVWNTDPNMCYYNAQTSAGPGLTYVEGLFASPDHPWPTPHAWVEYEGYVVELTYPDGIPSGAVYYGAEYGYPTVTDAMVEREVADPLLENPEAYPPRNYVPESADAGEEGDR